MDSRVVKLSGCKGEWVELAFNDYDGLPVDFHSLWVKWDGNRTLRVWVVYYQPILRLMERWNIMIHLTFYTLKKRG